MTNVAKGRQNGLDNDGSPWTRDQVILALELYCRIPFSKTKASHPNVKQLAALLQRTPASVARKLGNFGAFDPNLARLNITGLAHSSKLDKKVWDEFSNNWTLLVDAAHELRLRLAADTEDAARVIALPMGPSTYLVTVELRRHQSFFRDAVISSYESRCCITSLPIPACLVASHIIPWSKDEAKRADPTNGLCMSATFDRLFDAGLITFEDDMCLVIHQSLRESRDESVKQWILRWNGIRGRTPVRFSPNRECLSWHRQHVFLR